MVGGKSGLGSLAPCCSGTRGTNVVAGIRRAHSALPAPEETRHFLTLVLCHQADVQRTATASGSVTEINGLPVDNGAAGAAAPSRSDLRLLRQDQSVIDLTAEVVD